MGLFDWVGKRFMQPVEKQLGEAFLQMVTQRGQPPQRGTAQLLNSYQNLPWLRASVSRISTSVASVPWTLYVAQNRQGKAIRSQKVQYADNNTRKQYIKRMKAAGELREIMDHPLLDMLNNANREMTGRTARQLTQSYLDIKGESYWLIERNGIGMPIEYYPIPPHWVIDVPHEGNPTYRVSFQGWQGHIPETEMITFKDPDLLNPYGRGIGLAQALGDELETDEYAAKHTKAWFYNRATPDILVGIEGADENALKAAKAKWQNEHRGFKKAFRSQFHNGNISVHQLSQTFSDQQLIELREYERNTIIQVFGVPPEVLGIIENSNRATIDSADYLMAKYVTLPRLELLRTEMQQKLVPQFDERLILEYENPVPEDKEFKLKVATAAPWSITKNEWRELQDQDEVDDGDVYMVPLNLIPDRQGVNEALPQEIPEEHNQGEKTKKKDVRKSLDDSDILTIIEQLKPEYLTEELDPVFQELINEWGDKVLEDLGISVAFNMLNPLVVDHLREKSADKIKGLVNETTKEKLRETLIEGVRAGESIPQLAKRVSQVYDDAKGYRAVRIARTEVLSSSNFATWSAHKQSGVITKRQWLTTIDGRQRDSHEKLNGKIFSIDEPFSVTDDNTGKTHTALHPGAFDDASQDINCRCTTIAVIDDPDKSYSAEYLEAKWKQFDRDLIPWEKKVERAAKRGFQAQQNAVMKYLNNLR